ncbi:MAG: thymidine kinase [Calditrichaeota bacterium]|nr:thymidine kinase [Calditrichota bacterium]
MLNYLHEKQGWIEVICGSMYSGKSEELIRRLKRAEIAKQRIAIFKPYIDERYEKEYIISHDQRKLKSQRIDKPYEMLSLAKNADVIAIDEAQFMDNSLIDVVETLANAGKRVIVAGLDMDYRGEPFHPMPAIIAKAEEVTKVHAICVVCGNPANFSQRIAQNDDLIAIGSNDLYEARCRLHFIKPKHERKSE